MNKVVKKIINVFIDIIVILILIISIVVVILSLTSKSSGIPNIFGYAPLSVQSKSMSPTFEEGDLIIGQVLTPQNYDVKVGDVVTFPIDIDGEEVLNTHRVVEVYEDDGVTYYVTQGDNPETNPEPDEEMQNDATLQAKWTGMTIPRVGAFLSFLRTQLGFFLCILLPMIIFFVYEAIRVIMNVMVYNKEKAIEEAKAVVDASGLTEEQKQQAIAEYLAQQGMKGKQPAEEAIEAESAEQSAAEQEPTVQTPAEGSDADAGSQDS